MSYYDTLKVLALCDTIDKVREIRHDPEQVKRRKISTIDGSQFSKPTPKHDFLELDSIIKDKRQHPVPKSYNDDLIRKQIQTSSEAAGTLLRESLHLDHSALQSSLEHSTPSFNGSIQQQTRSIQNKKAIQHQHFQNSSNRLQSLSSIPATPLQYSTPPPPSSIPVPTPIIHSQPLAPIPFKPSFPSTPNLERKPSHTNIPTASSPLVPGSVHNRSNPSSRPSTPGHNKGRAPHNAGTTTSDDGTQEVCEYCERVFRGPKSSTHKQQHIKRIHPDFYYRKKGGVKKSHTYINTNHTFRS